MLIFCNQWALVYLSVLYCISQGYSIVKLFDKPESLYLLSNHIYRVIDSNSTWIFLQHGETIQTVNSSILKEFQLATPVPKIERHDDSFDDTHRLHLLKIDSLQERIIKNITLFYKNITKNPSLVNWNCRQLLLIQHYRGMNDFSFTFQWFDPLLKLPDDCKYYDTKSIVDPPIKNMVIRGLDQRPIILSESILLILYSNMRGAGNFSYSMALAVVKMSPHSKNNTLSLLTRNIDFDPKRNYWKRERFEKNWCPFTHNGTALMVQSINPLRVVAFADFDPLNYSNFDLKEGSVYIQLVSEAPIAALPWWEYGDLRGGTNALDIGDSYLAFFHTRPKLHHRSNIVTYFFGAYTFTKNPQFRLLAVSNVPIVDEVFYTGSWTSSKIAYGPYPTYVERDGMDLRLSMGYCDRKGFLLTLPLHSVLNSLINVE